jgi:hypothetical protein
MATVGSLRPANLGRCLQANATIEPSVRRGETVLNCAPVARTVFMSFYPVGRAGIGGCRRTCRSMINWPRSPAGIVHLTTCDARNCMITTIFSIYNFELMSDPENIQTRVCTRPVPAGAAACMHVCSQQTATSAAFCTATRGVDGKSENDIITKYIAMKSLMISFQNS